MRVFLSFLATTALIAAGLFMNSATAEETTIELVENTDSATPISTPADGAKAYKKCMGCHAKDGSGKSKLGKKFNAPDFTSAEWQKTHSLEQIKDSIRRGVPKTKMPAFPEKRLSNADLEAVAKHIKTMGK